MSKLTSVEWLWQQIDDTIPFINLEISQVFNGLLNSAKEMHKQEIKDAWMDGMEGILHKIAAEKYYNETFN